MVKGRVGRGREKAAVCSTGARLTRQEAKDVGERTPTINGKAEGGGHGAVAEDGV
jgi:hypothetical protein